MIRIKKAAVVDAVMASEAIAATRRREDGQCCMTGENVADAFERLVPHAASKAARAAGVSFRIEGDELVFETEADANLMEAAVVWNLLAMTGGGSDCRAESEAAAGALREGAAATGDAACKRRSLHYF